MDEAVAAVMAEYEARAQAEMAAHAGGQPPAVDELLLPVGPVTGHFMNVLIRQMSAVRLLEVGTSYGYSTLWLAEAARATGGRLVTLELQPFKSAHAQAQLERAGLAGQVELRVGDALELLKTLPGPFDFVLIDLWKDLYVQVFDLVYPLLAPGAVVVADNMLHPVETQRRARVYRAHVRAARDMTSVMLPLGSGIEVSRFRAP